MTTDHLGNLRKVDRLLSQVRTSIDPAVPVQLVQTFMVVAINEGKSVTEIAEIVGSNISTVSRHLLDLGQRDRNQKAGYDLVEGRTDPMELRRKVFSLTPKGKLLAAQLAKTLEG